MTISVMTANFKGGCGKTSIAHHLVLRAVDRGLRVLAVDCDRQGDLYRRVVGDSADLADLPPIQWAPGCLVAHSPDAYDVPRDAPYDIIVIDTGPGRDLPEGPGPNLVIIPIDSIDAARNANETLASARERSATSLIVMNGVEEGGKRQARVYEEMAAHLPPDVLQAPMHIPRGGAVKRAGSTGHACWDDVYKGRDAVAMQNLCDYLLDVIARLRPSGKRGAA